MLSFDMQGLWREMPLTFFDLETTGLTPGQDRIIEIGIVTYREGRLAERWGQLINPEMPIPPESIETHHITDEMVANEPTLREVAWEVWQRLRDRIMVAYNGLSFDKPMLDGDLARCGLTPPLAPVLDPMMWVIQLMPKRSFKQEAVCQQLGIELTEAHRAVADAEALAQITFRLADQVPPTLGELLARQQLWADEFGERRAERARQRAEREAEKAAAAIAAAEDKDTGQEGLF
jgi:DNA polymerase III epsilon subunit family exonuclease